MADRFRHAEHRQRAGTKAFCCILTHVPGNAGEDPTRESARIRAIESGARHDVVDMGRHQQCIADAMTFDQAQCRFSVPTPHQHDIRTSEESRQRTENRAADEAELECHQDSILAINAVQRRNGFGGVAKAVGGMNNTFWRAR